MAITMPRTVEEILAHADGLAIRLEAYTPSERDEINLGADAELRQAVAEQSATNHIENAHTES